MNILAIDAGNSRIKWGWFEDAAWRVQSWLPTTQADGLEAAWQDLAPPDRIVVSNVAGPAVRARPSRSPA